MDVSDDVSMLNDISGEPDLELVVTDEDLTPVPAPLRPAPPPRSRSIPVIAPASLKEPLLELIPDDTPGELSLEEIIARAEAQESPFAQTYDRRREDADEG